MSYVQVFDAAVVVARPHDDAVGRRGHAGKTGHVPAGHGAAVGGGQNGGADAVARAGTNCKEKRSRN